jgi:ribosome maturation factor RimP
MRSAKQQKLIAALETAAQENGFELVDVELAGAGRARVVRVLLDKSSGCSIDGLAEANSWVSAIVEDNDPYANTYLLEVSSPGVDRPLRTLEHFARFVGEEVKLTTEPIGERSNWTGTLAGVESDDVLLSIDGEISRIPYEMIKKARLRGRIDFKERIHDVI